MLKIENTEVLGWEHAIRGMRNPMNSWEKSDSYENYSVDYEKDETTGEVAEIRFPYYRVGAGDLNLMTRLRNAGTDHRKFMRMIVVYVDLTAPLYWWKEFDTYKVGTVANSCSTMHKIAEKEFTPEDFSHEQLINIANDDPCDALFLEGTTIRVDGDDLLGLTINVLNYYRNRYLKTKDKTYWWQMIQLLPSSYNQRRTVMLNYEVLANIYKSRRNHKLDEWHTFCDWIEGLPYSELITGIDWKKANPILHAERDENGNLLREMQKVIDPAERLSDTSKAMTDIMDKLIASRGKRSEIPGIVEDNIDCNEGLNKHFGGCEE